MDLGRRKKRKRNLFRCRFSFDPFPENPSCHLRWKRQIFSLKKCTLCAQKSCLIVWRICVDRFFSLSTILWFSVLFLPEIIFSWQFPALWLFGCWKGEVDKCCIHFVGTPVQKFTHFLFGYLLLRERFTPCYAPSSFFQHFNTFLCHKESQCQYISPCFAEFFINRFFSSNFFSKLKPVESRLKVLDCVRWKVLQYMG